MPTPSSGPISFLNLKNVFGAPSPEPINLLYRGGAYVPNITPNNDVPTSGEISLQEFYSTWGNYSLSFNMTIGSHSAKGKKGLYYGYASNVQGASFGSIGSNTFLTPNGTMTVRGLFYSTGDASWNLWLSSSSAPSDTDLVVKQIAVNGYSIGGDGIRSARTGTGVSGTSRYWKWSTFKKATFPTSGTVSCTLSYYG